MGEFTICDGCMFAHQTPGQDFIVCQLYDELQMAGEAACDDYVEMPDCGNCVKFTTCDKLDAYFNNKDPRLEEACKHGEEVYT